jgi:hypothetical protein
MAGRISSSNHQTGESVAMGRLLTFDVCPPARNEGTPGKQNLTTVREQIAAHKTVFGNH